MELGIEHVQVSVDMNCEQDAISSLPRNWFSVVFFKCNDSFEISLKNRFLTRFLLLKLKRVHIGMRFWIKNSHIPLINTETSCLKQRMKCSINCKTFNFNRIKNDYIVKAYKDNRDNSIWICELKTKQIESNKILNLWKKIYVMYWKLLKASKMLQIHLG